MNIGSDFNPTSTNVVNARATGEVVGRVAPEAPLVLSSDDEPSTKASTAKTWPMHKEPAKPVASKTEEKKRRRKKKWKKPKDKPSRPLSAYNLFFQSERSLMLGDDAPSEELENLKKRVHCKTHGKIGFAEMARAIGSKWKALDPEKKKVFEDQAQKEKDRYASQLAAWKEAQKEKADESKKRKTAAPAAVASLPVESTLGPPTQLDRTMIPSDALMMAISSGQMQLRNLPLLNQSQQNIDRLRALQNHHLGLAQQLENSLMSYPSAAEASASALLQQFQNQVPAPGASLGLMNQNVQLPQLNVANYQSNQLLAMQQLQLMANNNMFGNSQNSSNNNMTGNNNGAQR